jgi:GH35 family endo-1,4-beta-xylanase
MKQYILKTIGLMCLLLVFETAVAQLGKCKGKYFGNIISGSVPGTYNTYWNQATSENGSKWGSVEGTQGVYNFGNSDLAYNWAKNNNGLFKYHNLIWGGQTPGWVGTASTATITAAIDPYFKAVQAHYASMGGIKLMDVLNEPVNTPMPGNLKAALTAGYQAEPANANDKNNQYGWAIWCFQLARKYFPNTTLLVNEYNIEMNWNNCRAPYIAMVQAIKNAPNLTDGSKNLIDGVGLQCHGIDNLTAANFKACIDEIWTKTGVAVHITEFDQTANPNEAKQQAVYSSLIPVAWEHPHVAGITLWGYIQGQTWIGGNGQTGASGTDSGIIYANGTERPAMTWLKQYFASQSSLSCCPAPGPFASCTTSSNNPPTVTLTAPVTGTKFNAPATVTLTATASDADGTVSSVQFYNGTTLLGTVTNSPYSYTWSNVSSGAYTITAVATDNSGNKTTSSAVTITVVPVATITASGSTTFCSGGNVVLNASTGTGYSYVWKNGTTTITGATSSGYTATASGSYTVSISSNSQTTTSSATVVTVNSLPVITPYAQIDGGAWNQTSTATLCAGSTVVFGPQPVTTTGWSWTDPNGYSATSREITLASVTTSQGGTYTASYTDGNTCKSSATFTLTVNALPSAPTVTTPVSYCQNATATQLTATGTNLKWYTASTGGTGTTTAPTPTTATAGTTNYYVSQTTNTCESTRALIAVTVNTLPSAPIVTTPVSYCQNATATQLTATGTNLKWYTVSTGGIGSTTAPTPTTGTVGTTNYYVSQTTNTCESTRALIAVTVNALPTAPTVTTQVTYCQNATATQLTATGTNLKWYTAATGGTGTMTAPTPTTATAGTTNYYVSQTTNTCESGRTLIAVTVNAIPNAPAVTTPVSYCQNATATQLTATGTNLKWYTAATGGTGTTTAPTPTTATVGTTNYYVSQTTNTCESARVLIVVTVNALPAATITANGPTAIIQGSSVILTASSGSSYQWMSGTTTITGATVQTYTATDAGNYSVEITNSNSCRATSAATDVTVSDNQPSVITITSPQPNITVSGAIDIAVNVTDPDGSITLVEFLDGNTVIGTSTTAPYTFTWDNPSAGTHSITVRVTDSNGGITTSSAVNITSGTITTGVQSMSSIQAVIYPNPSSSIVYIETATDLSGASFTLIDVLGREVAVLPVMTGSGAQIDVSGLSEGTYVCIIKQDNSILRNKITVIK